jgi:hypothetical protein
MTTETQRPTELNLQDEVKVGDGAVQGLPILRGRRLCGK